MHLYWSIQISKRPIQIWFRSSSRVCNGASFGKKISLLLCSRTEIHAKQNILECFSSKILFSREWYLGAEISRTNLPSDQLKKRKKIIDRFLIITEKSKKQSQKSVETFTRKIATFSSYFWFLSDPESF
jgi:hypothetical protein